MCVCCILYLCRTEVKEGRHKEWHGLPVQIIDCIVLCSRVTLYAGKRELSIQELVYINIDQCFGCGILSDLVNMNTVWIHFLFYLGS